MLSTISININNKAKRNSVLPGINSMKSSKIHLLKNYIYKEIVSEKKKNERTKKKSNSVILTNTTNIFLKRELLSSDNNNKNESINSSLNIKKKNVKKIEIKNCLNKIEKKILLSNEIKTHKKSLSSSLSNKINDTTNLFNKLDTNKNNNIIKNNCLVNKYIPCLINKKVINNIPICINMPLHYKNKYANHSEYNRFIKFNEELLKLRALITLDSKNNFKYLKEFINFYGIKDECFYKNNYLCNLSNFVKSNFVNKINPNFSLRQNLIHALMEGAVVNTGFLEEEKIFISPFIRKTQFKKYPNRNILNKKEIMSIIDLEKQKILNERLN
jgi:hypothetical protein